ncbi:exopolysaccharide biosynthesis protein [Chroococcidiopsis sp. FACHB-1243]|uniref:exopolysaccharide biosynthesis protein n=1 Tax=Chroococcidiopsis sp. [FACHB-1243] TaxID=2692781 RepID=UPI00177BDA28|nr:exopolysaccharide biosynthesis protein [Chroococcidiopsis sp. [FACHB-1243]]MBD2304306.1 exopolysaccharide biosynthesis protein [Chroococcidiopsis sp. [FACHB-1243]]
MPSTTKSFPGLHTSRLLRQFLERHAEQEYVSLGELVVELGDRAYGPLLVICALPEALPLPVAGVSAIIAIPLMLVSAQLSLGFSRPYLPKWLAKRRWKQKNLAKVVEKGLNYLAKAEKIVRPRWGFITSRLVQRLLGLFILLMAIIIALPIPLGNMLPAIAIVVISLGMSEGDGLLVIVGVVAASIILAVMVSAIGFVANSLRSSFQQLRQQLNF